MHGRPDGIATTELLSELREVLRPSGGDDKFSQKVRNLKSHDTLERNGFATYFDGRYKITLLGETIARSGKAVNPHSPDEASFRFDSGAIQL